MKKRGKYSANFKRLVYIAIIVISLVNIIGNFILYDSFVGFSKGISGSVSSSGNVSLTVHGADTTFPLINLVYPENTTYTSTVKELNYTVSDNNALSTCWYTTDSGITNTTVNCGTNVTGLSAGDGSHTWTVYANDSAGNKNSSSTTFSVSIPVTPSSSGGGGGGGGGGISIPSILFDVIPNEINIFLISGEQDVKEIKVINTGQSSLFINVGVTGIDQFISLSADQLTLAPNQEKSVFMTVTAHKRGVYAGKILFKSGNIIRDVFVLMNINEGKALFDVSVTIPDSYRNIAPKTNLKSFISLAQLGEKKEVDVIVIYKIKDFDGKTLLEESETFRVFDKKSYGKDFVTSDFPPGDYIIGIEVLYPEGFATSSSHFSISERRINIWLIISIILAILTLVIILYSIYRYKRLKKRKRIYKKMRMYLKR